MWYMWSRMPSWTSVASWSSRSSSPLVSWCWTPCAVPRIPTAPGRWCRIPATILQVDNGYVLLGKSQPETIDFHRFSHEIWDIWGFPVNFPLTPIHWVGVFFWPSANPRYPRNPGILCFDSGGAWERWGLGCGCCGDSIHIILLFWESVVICWYKPNRSGSSDTKGRWSAFPSNVGQQMWSLRERWWSTPNRVIKPGWSDISCNPR